MSCAPPPPYFESCDEESIPAYSNAIAVAALVPLKMEFSQGSVLAKDRTWRPVWCSVEGTSLKLYRDTRPLTQRIRQKSLPSSPASVVAFDISSLLYAPLMHHHVIPSPCDVKEHDSALLSPSPLLRLVTNSTSSTDSILSSTSVYYAPALPQDVDRFFRPHALIRQYTLQGARCGLATGYNKRAHVIRVRAEGEQFLIQMPDLQSVVQWVETIQAAVDVAPDLDERPMPPGPIYGRHPADR